MLGLDDNQWQETYFPFSPSPLPPPPPYCATLHYFQFRTTLPISPTKSTLTPFPPFTPKRLLTIPWVLHVRYTATIGENIAIVREGGLLRARTHEYATQIRLALLPRRHFTGTSDIQNHLQIVSISYWISLTSTFSCSATFLKRKCTIIDHTVTTSNLRIHVVGRREERKENSETIKHIRTHTCMPVHKCKTKTSTWGMSNRVKLSTRCCQFCR